VSALQWFLARNYRNSGLLCRKVLRGPREAVGGILYQTIELIPAIR